MAKRKVQGLTKDDIDFDSTWNVLATALNEIHTKNASKLSFEELYRAAYKLVLKKKAELLYQRVSGLEEDWLCNHVRARVAAFVTPSLLAGAPAHNIDGQANERRVAGERFMKALKDAYEDHQLCMSMITDVLMYMVSLQFVIFAQTFGTLTIDEGPCVLRRSETTFNIHHCVDTVPSARTRFSPYAARIKQ